ncbi:sensor domain-containing diguanylate cyclase [Nitrosophilus labii]|uniref:sensor domain-containing diguanylate cyclase n=1 Tax=Nitrosophilus labii TaxID=2706014 RepID=UPI00165737C9|nr:diguanylate cyclase [Nitrosophilus labii]
MKFRHKIYLTLYIIFAVLLVLIYFIETRNIKIAENIIKKNIFNHRKSELQAILDEKTKFLFSLAQSLARHPQIIEGYKTDNREKIINLVLPLWKSLKKENFIYEIYFFKRPVNSFVNFSDLQKYDFDVSKVRVDIDTVNKSFQPSSHFLVCRTFPGFRVTYPIINNDKLLGSVSVGLDIFSFKQYLKKLDAKDLIIVLNNELLKKSLRDDIYTQLKKEGKIRKNFLIISNIDFTNLEIEEGLEQSRDLIYSKYKLEDFKKNLFGYIIVGDDIKKMRDFLQKHFLYENFLIIQTIFMLFFLYTFFIIRLIFKKVSALQKLTELIKAKKSNLIPSKTKDNIRFGKLQNSIIETVKELEIHINLLTQEIEQYKNKAYIDTLTKAFNRRFLDEYGKIVFEKIKIKKSNILVIMFDIDNFKHINDTFGHDFGDFILEELSKIVKKVLREDDIFIRYGGEEFLIILKKLSLTDGYKIAQKILNAINSHTFELGDKKAKVTISVGLSEIHPDDKTIYDIIKRADEKLYIAKEKGKNRIEI